MTDARWAVQLVGSDHDLDRIEASLDARFDPHLTQVNGTRAICSAAFDGLSDPSEVRDVAEAMVSVLRGAVELVGDPSPVTVGSVFRVWKEGRIDAFISASFPARLRIVGRPPKVTVRDSLGNVVEPTPTPTPAQQWVASALDNEDIADLLTFFGRADNWFDLYKTIEMAEKIEGGEHALRANFPGLKLAKMTANSHRHARGYVPESPISFQEAHEVVGRVVRTLLSKQPPPKA